MSVQAKNKNNIPAFIICFLVFQVVVLFCFFKSPNDLAIPVKVVTLCVCVHQARVALYVSLLRDGQPLTLVQGVEEYLCLPVSSSTTPSGDE